MIGIILGFVIGLAVGWATTPPEFFTNLRKKFDI